MEEREIRADYDARSIVVYQAYGKAIALPALQQQRFVTPFSFNRMTWIKPSFLWMMARSNWGLKPEQEMILAVRITRQGWEEALSCAVLTTYDAHVYRDYADWQAQIEQARVCVQWDPEKTIRGKKLPIDSIQVGLSRHIIEKYVHDWILEIVDYTPRVRKMYGLLQAGEEARARDYLPKERIYTLDAKIMRRLGMN